MVIMNFWSIKIEPCFQKSFSNEFFSFVKKIMPNGYIIEISKWAFILREFMGYSSKIFKIISPYQLTQTFFNQGFGLVLKGLMSGWNFSSQRLH